MAVDRMVAPNEASASFTLEPEPALAPEAEAAPRSRRAVLAAALAGVAGAVAGALGRPEPAAAAAGDSLKVGQQNFAGTAATRLSATSSGGAFWMTQNGSGSGVRGDSTKGHGGVFTTASGDRFGLYAQNTAPSSVGVGAAVRAEGGENTGVYATSVSYYGVYGESSSGYGVRGVSDSGVGVSGVASSFEGVYGYSPIGAGVRGESSSSTGVRGVSDASTGVHGSSTNGYGVYGYSLNSYAGYFSGTCYATSFATAAAATRIDHPLDPANQVLAHGFVESNERKTVYDGTVTTDAAGEATVSLPAWFEALNTDVRYQLTTIGSFAQAIVKREVKANRFVIATSEPNTRVSWQVTGVRADAYARAHPLEVEQAKTGRERGRYLNPIEHGQPESAGVAYEQRQKAPDLPVPAATGT